MYYIIEKQRVTVDYQRLSTSPVEVDFDHVTRLT